MPTERLSYAERRQVMAKMLRELGWRQAEAARESRLSASMVSRFLNGIYDLSPAAYDRLEATVVDALAQRRGTKQKTGGHDPLLRFKDLVPPRDPHEYEAWKARMMSFTAPEEAVRRENAALHEAVESLRRVIESQDKIITIHKEMIAELEARIAELKAQK